MEKENRIGAVIVAAGMSSRMQAFKPMLPLAEDSLIRTLIRRLMAAGAKPIVLVVGRNGDELTAHVADLPVECVYNPDYASTDMFCSVRIGMGRILGRCESVLFSPGDCPCFSPESAKALIQEMEKSHFPILIPSYQGRRGHPVLFHQDVVKHILTYQGEGGLRGALQAYPAEQAFLELDDQGLVMDADKPEDYQRLLVYCQKETAEKYQEQKR